MSDRRRVSRWLLVIGLALPGGPVTVRAQTQAEYRARVQALVPVWRRLITLKRYEDSVKTRALPRDTVRFGPLTVLVDSSLAPFGRAVARAAATTLERRFGSATRALRTHVYALTLPPGRPVGSDTVVLSEVDRVRGSYFLQSQIRDERLVTAAIVNQAAATLARAVGVNFTGWLGGGLPFDTAARATWMGVRIDLVTASSHVARACYAGADSACGLALGVLGEDDPVTHWFDAAERQDMVHGLRSRLRTDHEARYQRCTGSADDSACVALLRLLPAGQIKPPLEAFARQSLAGLALDIGGPEALARMATAPDDPGAQLAVAAGIPLDSLLGIWQRNAVSVRAANPSVSWTLVISSLFWVAACGALALRSSPWR
jgi:hypothetical protein